jgi:integrase
MPKKLTSLNIRKPGFHRADQNLYLVVRQAKDGSTTRSWVLRWERNGKARDMGLGRASDYTLAEARERARLVRQQLDAGIDPIEHRKAERGRIAAEQKKSVTFEEASRGYIQGQLTRWVSAHADGWIGSLRDWVHPIIGKMPVSAIETTDVLKVLQQPVEGGTFWTKRAVTAQRCRSRIEIVLGWAGAQGHRQADIPNPARWKGHLQFLLPAASKLAAPVPQPALPYAQMPAFMAALAKHESVAARALQFVAFTAVRTADVARAKVGDVDFPAATWRIASYSKTGRPLAIPLSPQALAIATLAKEAASIANGTILFPGVGEGAMTKLVRRDMGYAGRMSPHGCRAVFKTWATEQTSYPRELIEVSLGHAQGTAVEQRYLRGDAVEKRRRLMNDWSAFVTGQAAASGEVVPLKRKR